MIAVASALAFAIFNIVRAEGGEWHLRFQNSARNTLAVHAVLLLPVVLLMLALPARRSVLRSWALAAGLPMALLGLLLLIARTGGAGTLRVPPVVSRTLRMDAGVATTSAAAMPMPHAGASAEQILPILPGIVVCRPTVGAAGSSAYAAASGRSYSGELRAAVPPLPWPISATSATSEGGAADGRDTGDGVAGGRLPGFGAKAGDWPPASTDTVYFGSPRDGL